MHGELVARAIAGISCAVTIDQFMLCCNIRSKSVAKTVLEFLKAHEIGISSNNVTYFSDADRIKTAMLALRMGTDLERISEGLTWKDFEAFSQELLNLYGYKTHVNLRFTNPSMEIDVIGIRRDLAILIDCKHWKKNNLASTSEYAKKQLRRSKLFLKKKTGVSFALPVILTLHAEKVQLIDKIPVVPISKLDSFLKDIQTLFGQICIVRLDEVKENS
jgi:Restriction endonuclease